MLKVKNEDQQFYQWLGREGREGKKEGRKKEKENRRQEGQEKKETR